MIDRINHGIGLLVSFSVLGILGVIIVEVVLRRLFHAPQLWTMDVICMTFGCYIILICAYGFQKQAFVAVDVLYAKFSPLAQHVLDFVTQICFMVPFVFVLFPLSFRFFYQSFVSGEKGYSVWAPPVWPVKLALTVGLLLLSLQGVSEILKNVTWIMDYCKTRINKGLPKTTEEGET